MKKIILPMTLMLALFAVPVLSADTSTTPAANATKSNVPVEDISPRASGDAPLNNLNDHSPGHGNVYVGNENAPAAAGTDSNTGQQQTSGN